MQVAVAADEQLVVIRREQNRVPARRDLVRRPGVIESRAALKAKRQFSANRSRDANDLPRLFLRRAAGNAGDRHEINDFAHPFRTEKPRKKDIAVRQIDLPYAGLHRGRELAESALAIIEQGAENAG